MKKLFLFFSIAVTSAVFAQDAVINPAEVKRIESMLASDDMRGRRTGTPDIDRAAAFIADEFKKAGLQPLAGKSFLQEFTMVRPKLTSLKYEVGTGEIDPKNIILITSQPELKVDEKSAYEIQTIAATDNFSQKAQAAVRSNKNLIVFIDTAHAASFPRLMNLKRQLFMSKTSVIFILGVEQPKEFKIKAEEAIEETKFTNVVGVLPGKSRKNEYVIFSGHYDHLGIARQAMNGDSIYNRANDDAAGTTAVIMLANHFRKLNNNERTLVFAAFTAEEIGGFGSRYFSTQFDPAQVVAMFNIEMIGTESKWGKNAAYITGFEKT
ncbi:MAG TPA: M28 family peptidase, partial [Flavisolibacter sp.]|nr:M28 family peptidase [Flavisolibacter sp.]